jgi:hypothetical protein
MEREVPRLGIKSRVFLLVYQWDLLSRSVSGKLGKENEILPAM